jgi:hypothetical protein
LRFLEPLVSETVSPTTGVLTWLMPKYLLYPCGERSVGTADREPE